MSKNTTNNIRLYASKSLILLQSNKQSKIKPIKTGKELGTRYYLRCKDYTHNFKPPEVKMTNKVLREKSRFSKQKHNNNKIIQWQDKFSNPIKTKK